MTVTGNIVHPVNINLHSSYTFFIEVTDSCKNDPAYFGTVSTKVGGTNGWKLVIGCNSRLTLSSYDQKRYQEVELNGDGENIWTFINPASDRPWCLPLENTLVNKDGSRYTGSITLAENKISVTDTSTPGTYKFLIKSVYLQGETTSPQVTIIVKSGATAVDITDEPAGHKKWFHVAAPGGDATEVSPGVD